MATNDQFRVTVWFQSLEEIRMRRITWLLLIAGGVVALLNKQAKHQRALRANDNLARADWEGEGGAPAPTETY
jgi:hypothetical protein